MAVELSHPNGKVDVLVLDPKYKLDGDQDEDTTNEPKPKKRDIDAMHAYRDAIRDSQGNHVVRYAAILYPGPDVRYGVGLAALHAYPTASEPLRRNLHDTFMRALTPTGASEEDSRAA